MKTFKRFVEHSRNLYYVQPDGTWKKGGDGRSEGKAKCDLPKGAKIAEDITKPHPKYKGISTQELIKKSKDNRVHSPKQRKEFEAEVSARANYRENTQLDEISKDLKKNYLDKAKDDHYDAWTGRGKYKQPKNPNDYTPTGKLKKGVRDRPAAVEYRRKMNQRAKYINKASKELIGKKQFAGIGEEAQAGAPANNTTSGPGMGSDNSLHMKKMRMFKKIWRRHRLPKQ